ncbi:Cyanate hydratase [Naganishia albida]|nr:Cyanate hydratase [Naganishia albida]
MDANMSTTGPLAGLPAACHALLDAKAKKGLNFEEISKQIGKPEVWTAALFYGQAKPDEATLTKLSEVLEIEHSTLQTGLGGAYTVHRGESWTWPPKDPVLYRLYEVLVVYGYSYKALIAEKFGDGIMSAIDFRTSVKRKADPKGDRVVITMDGKFLPYSLTGEGNPWTRESDE